MRGWLRRRSTGLTRSTSDRLCPSSHSVDGSLTGYENLLIFAKLYDIPSGQREARVRDALAFISLDDSAAKLVREYSGGMIRRLEIAQSTLHRPPLLFLDEGCGRDSRPE